MGGGQRAGHRLEPLAFRLRGIRIETYRQGLDQGWPIRPFERIQPGMDWVTCLQVSRTRTAPSSQQGPSDSPASSGWLSSRLSPLGVIAPNRNLPRSLR